MMADLDVLHFVDDRAMGGVMRALDNFRHPVLTAERTHRVFELGDRISYQDLGTDRVAVIHATANWRKLLQFARIGFWERFRSVILIEHSYTAGFEACCVAERDRFRRMLRLAYRCADFVVAVSEEQGRWMRDNELAPVGKIRVIPQARDCSEFFNMEHATRTAGPLRLAAYGRFHEQKGFDLLLEAMKGISPETATLRLAGKGPDLVPLKDAARALPHVDICPPFDSPTAFLTDADVVVIPSRWEAFGLVGAEARAAGRPLIVAEVDGLKDQIGTHSWTHQPKDLSSLQAAICDAAAESDLAKRATRAREHVRGEHKVMLEAWHMMFEQAAA